jgi:hypothetical protein
MGSIAKENYAGKSIELCIVTANGVTHGINGCE